MPNEVYAKLYEMLSNFATQSIKCLMLINGGAAIAILAFIGNFVGQENININAIKSTLPGLSNALSEFSFGVMSATLASFLAYLCQLLFLETAYIKTGIIIRFLAILSAIYSLITFYNGVTFSYNAFITLSNTIK